MSIEVSEGTLQKAEKCWRGYRCLSAEDGVCPVRDYVSEVLFVERRRDVYCPYDVTFGYSHICTCPVRREIYERYDI